MFALASRRGRRAAALFISIGALALLDGCAIGTAQPPPASPETGDVVEGLRIAESHCSTCHAIGAAGESRNSKAPPFRYLSKNYPVNALEEAFAEGILVGHPEMPEFHLSPEQINDLLAYLQRIQTRRGG